MPDVEEPPPSKPESPLAIERLVASIEALRRELVERDRMLLDAFARMEANYQLFVGELKVLSRARVDHEARIAALEVHALGRPSKVTASSRKRRAARPR